MQSPVLGVRHKPDNFKHGLFHRVIKLRKLRDSHLPADRVFVPQVFLYEHLVHNGQLARSVHFRFREPPSVHEPNLQNGKISFADQLKHGVPFFCVRFTRNFDVAGNPAIRGQRAGFGGFDHTRQSFQPLQQRAVKSHHLVRGLVALHGQRKPCHQNMIRLQAELHVAKGDKTSRQKSRGNQQRQGKPHFQHNHGVAQPAVTESPADALSAIPQRLIQILASCFESGNEAKHQGGQRSYTQREQQHRQIQSDDRFGRNNILGHQCNQRLETSPGQERAQSGPAGCQEQALHE